MKLEVSRNVVRDLWPLYRTGEASADSRAVVEAYLTSDPEFAATMKESDRVVTAMPGVRLSPDAELRILADAQQRARTRLLVIGGGIAAAAFIILVALAGAMFVLFRTV